MTDTTGSGPIDPLAGFRLDGRVALVTGASSGLGARMARVLAGLGARVAVSARRTDRIEALAGTLPDAVALPCDVSRRGASAQLVADVVDRLGQLDVVVANAGISNVVPALREPLDRFADVVEVDLLAPFELAQAAAAHFREAKRPGVIVNIASAAGIESTSLLPQAAYVAAKTGLIGLTRELALQWSRYGVRVNALCPGMFPSEMTAEVFDSDDLRNAFARTVVLGRVGAEHELDGAVAFLASDASSYMTGRTLVIDGGGSAG